MKCKDIPTVPILEFLIKHEGQPCTWYGRTDRDVRSVIPKDTPDKIVLAKIKQLIKKGLVAGCGCGCRGDFKITQKGKDARFEFNSLT